MSIRKGQKKVDPEEKIHGTIFEKGKPIQVNVIKMSKAGFEGLKDPKPEEFVSPTHPEHSFFVGRRNQMPQNMGRARSREGQETPLGHVGYLRPIDLGRRNPRNQTGPPKSGERRKGPNEFLIESNSEGPMTTRRTAELKKFGIPHKKRKTLFDRIASFLKRERKNE